MKTIYALLVGIDDYAAPVPALRGCANDIRAMAQYLESRVDPGTARMEDVLKLKVLVNGEATRDAVITAFLEHLRRAGPEDVALFCYSGHGSQEQAPEAFWAIEPDHLNETLVLHDSRAEGSWDLADKELAKLITQIAAGGAHMVVLLDCCHSGSGTRGDLAETAVRRAPTDLRRRPPDSYLFAPGELPAPGTTRGAGGRTSGWDVAGRHVLLAACRDDEEAKEYQGGGISRGAFSYFLGETLRTAGGGITYRALFDRAAALVRGEVQRQSPQLEATDPGDLHRPFLGGAIRPASRTYLATHRDGLWSIDAGRVHGIPAPTPDDAVELALFAGEASDEDITNAEKALAKAKVSRVMGAASQVEIVGGAADPAAGPLKALISHLPAPRLRAKLEGDARGVELARTALDASLFLREPAEGEAADFRLIARGEQYLVARPNDDRPLVGQIDGYTASSARQAVERLEHIERWKSTAELDNPATSIGPDELQVEILQDGKPLTGSDIRLEYTPGDGDEWVNPEVAIRLSNTGNRTLYVGLLDLPQTFGIFPMLSDVGSQRLAPGDQAFANRGEPIQVTVPDELWRRGVAELKDIVKVIVSTSEFDARRLAQEDLEQPKPSTRSAALKGLGVTRGIEQLGTLERLMERVQTRHAGPGTAKRIDDWRTLQFAFTTVRPLPAGRLDPGRGVTLTDGLRIEPHPALRAGAARLTTMPVATRAVGRLAPLPRLLYDDPRVVQPFEFGATRAVGGVLNVLELSDVADPRVVTPDQPLRLTIPRPLGPGEHVLPVAFDGEFYLPLGRAESAGGDTRVILDRLPCPTEAQSRSLGSALRILFQKVIARAFGTGYRYPILAVAEVGDDFRVRYEPDPDAVRARVDAARRIALFVHGIIGDTREMAASLRRAGVADRYDLVLTFDYENLQDPISETARALKGRLEAAGLTPGHGKSLEIIAHSMGGLVSRWFIEREGGNSVVRRLIMLGTPNGGSPWPCVEDWATTALGVGLNGLSMVLWPASALAGLVQAVEAVDVTLDQMIPDSGFLKDLYASPDPKVPYVMVAGDTSMIAASAGDDERRSKLWRLLAKLWSDRTKYDVADLFFGGSENDIAVSLASMRHLAEGRISPCEVRPVACDHLSYFHNPEALKILASIL
jgi:hypothetical protein